MFRATGQKWQNYFRNISKYFRNNSKYFEIFWNIPKYFEIFRNISKYFEIFRNILEYFEIFRNISKYSKIFRNIPKYIENHCFRQIWGAGPLGALQWARAPKIARDIQIFINFGSHHVSFMTKNVKKVDFLTIFGFNFVTPGGPVKISQVLFKHYFLSVI